MYWSSHKERPHIVIKIIFKALSFSKMFQDDTEVLLLFNYIEKFETHSECKSCIWRTGI